MGSARGGLAAAVTAVNIGATAHSTQGPASRSAATRRPHAPRPARRALTRCTRARHRCGLSCVLLLTPRRIAGITTSTSRTRFLFKAWQAKVRPAASLPARTICCPACGLALSPLRACSPAVSRSRAACTQLRGDHSAYSRAPNAGATTSWARTGIETEPTERACASRADRAGRGHRDQAGRVRGARPGRVSRGRGSGRWASERRAAARPAELRAACERRCRARHPRLATNRVWAAVVIS